MFKNSRLVLFCVAVLITILSPVSSVFASEIEWKLFTPFNHGDRPSIIYRAFAADLSKATGGRLKLNVYSAGELPYKNSDALRILATKQVEMADIAIGPVSGDVPELNVFVLPFVCTSMDQYYKASEPALAVIDKRFRSKFGVRALTSWTMPPQEIWLQTEVGDIKNLKDRKIRTWNRTQAEMLDLMGASGVAITPSEVIPALQRGVVDGAITASIPAYDWKFYEVLNVGYMLNFTMTNQVVAVNNERLEELPTDLQEIVISKTKEWQSKFRDAISESLTEAEKKLQEKGMILEVPTEADFNTARELTRPMWEKWANKNGEVAKELLSKVSAACSK